jgi:hypothetical protein
MNKREGEPGPLKHYTRLPALFGILETGSLTFGDPASWEDKHDRASLEAYRRLSGRRKARVLCLAEGTEQIHHWFYYAKKDSGCCIHFKTSKFLAAIKKESRFLCGFVNYTPEKELSAAELKKTPPEAIPFIKRRAYEGEKEYRIIWTGEEDEEAPGIPVLDLIQSITLGPGPAGPFRETLKQMLKAKYGLPVNFSRLLENPAWIRKFDRL